MHSFNNYYNYLSFVHFSFFLQINPKVGDRDRRENEKRNSVTAVDKKVQALAESIRCFSSPWSIHEERRA
jgi:hypothetical protein